MAAGLGFKTFNTGDVLTAGDTNGYLMQGVLVFASAAARDAAITSPEEGQFAYLKDTNVTTYYTGSAWTNLVAGGTANEAVGYKYTLWNPTNTTGTTTNAPATGTSSGNTTNISVSNSSGTLTATLAATGLYLFTFTGNLSVQDAYGYAEMRAAFGGTATLFIDTTNPAAQWGDGDTDGNMTLSASFLLNVASANQTVTVLPDGRIGTGFATASYDFTANVAIVRM
jgi:hypothetical protein